MVMNDEWIKHDGKCFPVPKGTLVDIKCRNGDRIYGIAAGIKLEALAAFWRNEGEEVPYDIVEYRICVKTPSRATATILPRENMREGNVQNGPSHLAASMGRGRA